MVTAISVLILGVLVFYLVAGLDDIFLDLIYIFRHKQVKPKDTAPSTIDLDRARPIAIMIPAWQESGVVVPMIESTLELAHYPASKLEFFVGVYPNDTVTVEEVRALAAKRKNVHCVINEKSGPTNKSQNLNYIYKYIDDIEKREEKRFAGIAIHDAEDVIHPYTFKLYNSLISKHAVVQLPVFALFPKTHWWGRLISGTYVDEFATHHLHKIPVREHLGMFVPSAGTGFIIRRDVAERLAQKEPLFTEGSLTEDYEFAFRLWRIGCKVHFHLQRLVRLDDKGRLKKDFVAVREYFPSELQASVKQKGRWTYGITIQTPKIIDWKKMSIKDRLTLWHDQKGKYTNFIHLLGYPLALYALLSTFLPIPAPKQTPLILGLGIAVLAMTLFRLAMRFTAVYEIYGFREAAMAALVPPLLPLRWLVATYINTLATIRAWRLLFWPNGFGKPKLQNKGAVPKWDKTERKGYVAPEILAAARRRLGDDLLFYNDIKPKDLASVIQNQGDNADYRRLGEIVTDSALISKGKVNKRLAELLKVKPRHLDLDEGNWYAHKPQPQRLTDTLS
jgi:adsorption protein B